MAMDGARPKIEKASGGQAMAGGERSREEVSSSACVLKGRQDAGADGPGRQKRPRMVAREGAQLTATEKPATSAGHPIAPPPPATATTSPSAAVPMASTVPPSTGTVGGPPSPASSSSSSSSSLPARSAASGAPPPPSSGGRKKRFTRGSIEDLTSEALRILQAKGPLTLPEIVKELPRFIREQAQQHGGIMEKVMEVLRVTPLVNLVRYQSPPGSNGDGPLLYAFLEGQKVAHPVDLSTVGAQLREMDHQERAVKRRVEALKMELARLDGGGAAGPEEAATALGRVLARGVQQPGSSREGEGAGQVSSVPAVYAAAMMLTKQELERQEKQQKGVQGDAGGSQGDGGSLQPATLSMPPSTSSSGAASTGTLMTT